MQMAQLGYAQVKSLSTQLTHADGPVGICTRVIILSSRMQMAQLGYAQVKSLSTQLTHAVDAQVPSQLTHADWDMHK